MNENEPETEDEDDEDDEDDKVLVRFRVDPNSPVKSLLEKMYPKAAKYASNLKEEALTWAQRDLQGC